MILQHGLSEDSSYTINQSLRFRSSNSAYLSRTLSQNSTSQQIMTWSGWVKRGALGAARAVLAYHGNSSATGNMILIEFYSDAIRVLFDGGGTTAFLTSQVFRDISAHFHLQLVYDSTQATAANRAKLYINGVQVTSFSAVVYPSLNQAVNNVSSTVSSIGAAAGSLPFDGYLSEINFIDGQALDPSYFGQTDPATGIWVPKKYTGTYGNNGFYLPFNDATSLTTLGYDRSGNGNNWTCNGISVTAGVTYDVMKDSPINGAGEVGNYATLNPLDKDTNSTLSNGNLTITTGGGTYGANKATTWVNSGKWYWEYTEASTSAVTLVGIVSTSANPAYYVGQDAYGWGYASFGVKNNINSFAAYGSSYTTNDVIGIAFNADSGTLEFLKNGVSQGVAFTGITGSLYTAAISDFSASLVATGSLNFGQRPFAYTPPTGFKALHTGNLSATTPVTTSGTFTGNASTDGPCIFINGTPTAMTINGNAVTFGTHADKLAGGFKVRSSSASYNASGTNTYSITTNGGKFKYTRAQGNP